MSLPFENIKTFLKDVKKSREKELVFTNTYFSNLLGEIKCHLLQMNTTNKCLYPEIDDVLKFLSQNTQIINNKILYSKLLDCCLHTYTAADGYERKNWVLNMIRLTLHHNTSLKGDSLVLTRMGMNTTSILTEEIKQNVEVISSSIKKRELSLSDPNVFIEHKLKMIKIIAFQIIEMPDAIVFLPIMDSILQFLLAVPNHLIDDDFITIIEKIKDIAKSQDDITIPYTMYIKIWKLHLPSLEKDVLLLIKDCSHCLPIPSALEDQINKTYLVKCCSEDNQVYSMVYKMIYNILMVSNGSPVMMEFISCFLSSVNKLHHKTTYYLHSEKYHPLLKLLNQSPIGMSNMFISHHIEHIVEVINKLPSQTAAESMNNRFHFFPILLQNKYWYHLVVWNVFNIQHKHVIRDFVQFILWYHIVEDGNKYMEKLTESVINLRGLLQKKSLRILDIEYGVYNIISIQELQPITKHILFIFLFKSELGCSIFSDIFKLAKCNTATTVLMMMLYCFDVHSINRTEFSKEKIQLFKDIIRKYTQDLKMTSGTSEPLLLEAIINLSQRLL